MACSLCKWQRQIPKRLQKGVPIEPRILVMASRSKSNPHVLDVAADRRVACTSCKAAVHGLQCWAQASLQRRLDKSKQLTLRELLRTKELVYAVLADHPEARDDDHECVWWYFRDWHQVPATAAFREVLDLSRAVYGSFWMDRIVRIRAQIQNVDGHFPPCNEIGAGRHTQEKLHHDHFAAEGSASA